MAQQTLRDLRPNDGGPSMVIRTVSHLRANVAASDQRLAKRRQTRRDRRIFPAWQFRLLLQGAKNITVKTAKQAVTLRKGERRVFELEF